MREQLGGIISEGMIRTWLISQDGFRLRKDRILPALDAAAKVRRLVWTHSTFPGSQEIKKQLKKQQITSTNLCRNLRRIHQTTQQPK